MWPEKWLKEKEIEFVPDTPFIGGYGITVRLV